MNSTFYEFINVPSAMAMCGSLFTELIIFRSISTSFRSPTRLTLLSCVLRRILLCRPTGMELTSSRKMVSLLVLSNNHPFGIGDQHAVVELIKNGQIVCTVQIQ